MKLSYTTKLFLKKSALIPILYTTILNPHVKSLDDIYPKSLCNKPHNKDIHNIYPTSYNLNFIRSNYNYSILNISDSDVININNNLISKKRQLFYPREQDRGIVARAILYMNYNYNYNYISRACGFIASYDLENLIIEKDSINWILNTEIIKTNISNEENIHVKIFH